MLPAILVPGIYYLLANLDKLTLVPEEVWHAGPFVISIILLTMSMAFNRSRMFFTGIVLLLILIVQWMPFPQPLNSLIIYGIFPVNMVVILLYGERGILTSTGILRTSFILLQAGIIYFAFTHPEYLEMIPFDSAPREGILAFFTLDLVTAVILGISSVVIVILMNWQYTPTARSIFFATLVMLVSYSLDMPHATSIYAIAATIVLCVAILQDSYTMAYLDELTGLPQRRALNEHFMSLGNHYAIAMLDIDHFKKLNDSHGHDVGDQVLQMVAAKMRQVGGGGKPFRYGGEEFTIVFSRKVKGETIYFLESVRESIQNYKMIIREGKRVKEEETDQSNRSRGSFNRTDRLVSVTISIGVSDRSPAKETPADVLKRADEALYMAKNAGRNRLFESDF